MNQSSDCRNVNNALDRRNNEEIWFCDAHGGCSLDIARIQRNLSYEILSQGPSRAVEANDATVRMPGCSSGTKCIRSSVEFLAVHWKSISIPLRTCLPPMRLPQLNYATW